MLCYILIGNGEEARSDRGEVVVLIHFGDRLRFERLNCLPGRGFPAR